MRASSVWKATLQVACAIACLQPLPARSDSGCTDISTPTQVLTILGSWPSQARVCVGLEGQGGGPHISFADSPPLALLAGSVLDVTCLHPDAHLDLHSAAGALDVRAGATLRVRGCRISTLPSLAAAALPLLPLELSPTLFGRSRGHIELEDCRLLVPLQFVKSFVSINGSTSVLEAEAAADPSTLLQSTPVFVDPSLQSAAIAVRAANFTLAPSRPRTSTPSLDLTNTSLWFSLDSFAAALPLLAVAEGALAADQDSEWVYGAGTNPGRPYPESSRRGRLDGVRLPPPPSGDVALGAAEYEEAPPDSIEFLAEGGTTGVQGLEVVDVRQLEQETEAATVAMGPVGGGESSEGGGW
eukprot:jgi/Ulvmu1/9864/UM057_0018.1